MPEPRDTEDKTAFMRRCVPEVIADGGAKNSQQAVAMCSSMWSQAKTKQSRSTLGLIPSDHGLDPEQVFITSL